MNQGTRLSPTFLGRRGIAYASMPNPDGLRVVNFQDGSYGVMNHDLQIITRKRYDDALLDDNGGIRVWQDGKEIQINSSGEIIK